MKEKFEWIIGILQALIISSPLFLLFIVVAGVLVGWVIFASIIAFLSAWLIPMIAVAAGCIISWIAFRSDIDEKWKFASLLTIPVFLALGLVWNNSGGGDIVYSMLTTLGGH